VPAVAFQAPQVLFQAPQPQPQPQPQAAPAERPPVAPVAAPTAGDDENGTRPARRRSRSKPDTGPSDKNEASAGEAPPAAAETSGPDDASGPDDDSDEDGGQSGRKRRRRGGRSRSRGRGNGDGDAAEDGPDDAESAGDSGDSGTGADQPAAEDTTAAEDSGDDEDNGEGDENGNGQGRRRRRKRRRGSASDSDKSSEDDPPDTVVHVREVRPAATRSDDVRSVKGSTRLEAKRQRRREGRESGRRRPPVITESEFLARREAVERTMVVRRRGDRTQIAVLEDDILVEHYVNRSSQQSYVGNVYLGKVQNVLPSMEAAFVDIGKGRNAVLYAGEVNFDASGLEGQSKRIESALKSGQSILVQVTKDPVGHKGARLTSQVSLPGRYLVYVPGASMTGISRKLPDTERTRLKKILKKVMPEDAGVIVRTAAEGATEEELERDVARLSAQWENIERRSKTASAPELLYGEPDLTVRVIRDVFNEDFSQLIVSGDEGWAEVDEYVKYVAPHLAERLSHWEDPDEDVFGEYRIDEQLGKALERKVWLPSGGSLVIDRTEAMTVIDVNTGKFTGQGGNLEETVTRNNLEAAEEIVRQLRLRDVGGIIVIDFIDMVLESNRELVLRRLLECLARDRTKHQVAEVTSLGLVQMTRKRVGAGLFEAFSQPCECCNGRGVHVSLDLADIGSSGSNESNGRGRGRHERRGESGDQGQGKPEASNGNGHGHGSNGPGSNGPGSNGPGDNGNGSNGESKPGEGRRSRNRRRGNRQDLAPATGAEAEATQDVPAEETGEVSSAVATLEATEAAGQPTEPAELTELLVPAETPPATETPVVETIPAPEVPAPEVPAATEAPAAELGPDLEAVEVPTAGLEPAAETPAPPTEGH
jgi:ribonuclease E